MRPVKTFSVSPHLPESLEPLRELAHNLRWAWNQGATSLFRRLDSDLWRASGHNPVRMLGEISQERLDEASQDNSFIAHLEGVRSALQTYLASPSTWYHRTHPHRSELAAYFSAEFGITECLPIFAGGLGVLAGDHLKSASDLGVPLVGVGLLYQQGYFQQYLNETGWQQEVYEDNDFHTLPITLERLADGSPVTVQVAFPGRTVQAQVWRAQVGRVSLYLLDANIAANSPADRAITHQLYGGDQETRIKQELLLGIGGCRALEALGIEPTVYHINEGHSAFLVLERIRDLIERHRVPFAVAAEAASASLTFTTHTPVAAGHDFFPASMVDRYLGEFARSLGLQFGEFMALGRTNPSDQAEPFCMTTLALRMAAHSNGVSRLHGETSRRMWHSLWPAVPEREIPIGHVTNGVHFSSWVSLEMDQLFERYLVPGWHEDPTDTEVWQRVDKIPGEELWRSHERRRERLVAFARSRLHRQLQRLGASQAEQDAALETLDSRALTIGFGRRFATYKRATLILANPERLARILGDPDRPVQIIFAGKAHPKDEAGKELIRQITRLGAQPEFRRRLIFLEGYDLALTRYLVQGSDVWLNTPRRPLEASGTSGMKAAANGVLNLSTLDGWWDEAWRDCAGLSDPPGWAIGRGEAYADERYQDQVEAEALLEVLERDVIPTFYDRGADGLPRRWIARMKAAQRCLNPFFNTDRMVWEYTERIYLPAAERARRLAADGLRRARELAAWKSRVREAWPQLRVESIESGVAERLEVGSVLRVSARVHLGRLSPDEVRVELYAGRVDAHGDFAQAIGHLMRPRAVQGESVEFEVSDVPCLASGLQGITVRVLPHNPDAHTHFLPGLIVWADDRVRLAGLEPVS